ncbi:MAG: Na+/H+ antiporter NhaA [candidate division Zixibacteria bacterium]|nr:Na+/H+ antiporter NhaA [candidate division Zixibacteria bacterium]
MTASEDTGTAASQLRRVTQALQRFIHVEAAGGVVLLVCTLFALAFANSPLSYEFLSIWKTELGLSLGAIEFSHSLKHWINDGLMAIFFFVIGLEVKRELTLGELRDPRQAALPIVGAIGGMIVPAGIYLALQAGEPGMRGWGVPMATDIAFVVGCMAILGKRVPRGLRVMILSLAIADDVGAILVIAIGYTDSINLLSLALGVVGIGAVLGLSRLGVRRVSIYVIVGSLVWLAFHESGVHATIAGVILGLLTPSRSHGSPARVGEALNWLQRIFEGHDRGHHERPDAVRGARQAIRETISPLEYLENTLHPWVAFLIMPVFALANAGVPIVLSDLTHPVAVATAAGLVIGKPLGITLMAVLAVRFGIASLPESVTWRQIIGGGLLAGIGFTMALFIASLAFEGELLNASKVGILVASALSAIAGFAILATGGAKRVD